MFHVYQSKSHFDFFFYSSRSKVKGHLQLYAAYVNFGEQESSTEASPEDQGWEVIGGETHAGREEQPAQVRVEFY